MKWFVSPKGAALIQAVNAGLIPKNENGDLDITVFDGLWSIFEKVYKIGKSTDDKRRFFRNKGKQ